MIARHQPLTHPLPTLDFRETETAIRRIKVFFQDLLAAELNLLRVTAPLFVASGTGINDDLNGVERPVTFPIAALGGQQAEIVQSLAKWKRLKLAQHAFQPGEGLYTDMNAIRPDEELDALHSIYVDQWDWERVITSPERTVDFLHAMAQRVYRTIQRAEQYVGEIHPAIQPVLPETLPLFHTEELYRRFPDLSPQQREDRICEEHGAVFLRGIGAPLPDGEPHDGRAPDYDDWSTPAPGGPGLNGDILVWHPRIGRAVELSSMGIRVDAGVLRRQLALRGAEDRAELMFHRRLLAGELPLTVGGGIGQSRLCLFFLRKTHIREVQGIQIHWDPPGR